MFGDACLGEGRIGWTRVLQSRWRRSSALVGEARTADNQEVTASCVRRTWLALSCSVVSLFCSGPAFAQAECQALDDVHLAGVVDGAAVRLYLRAGYPAQAANGVYGALIYIDSWSPVGKSGRSQTIELEGTILSDCELRFEEHGSGDETLAEWRLSLTADGAVSGMRVALPLRTPEPMRLRVAEPVDCSGAGSWTRYTEPGLPVRFEYPAAWRLGKSEGYLRIACPDPERVALDRGDIFVSHGLDTSTRVRADSGVTTRELESFYNFGGAQWWFGNCEGTPDDTTSFLCGRARESSRLGMIVLQAAAGENRRYRPNGGYQGQGEPRLNYLFRMSGWWVHVQESDGNDAPDFQTPGPVVFDGDSVSQRFVRSIRPLP